MLNPKKTPPSTPVKKTSSTPSTPAKSPSVKSPLRFNTVKVTDQSIADLNTTANQKKEAFNKIREKLKDANISNLPNTPKIVDEAALKLIKDHEAAYDKYQETLTKAKNLNIDLTPNVPQTRSMNEYGAVIKKTEKLETDFFNKMGERLKEDHPGVIVPDANRYNYLFENRFTSAKKDALNGISGLQTTITIKEDEFLKLLDQTLIKKGEWDKSTKFNETFADKTTVLKSNALKAANVLYDRLSENGQYKAYVGDGSNPNRNVDTWLNLVGLQTTRAQSYRPIEDGSTLEETYESIGNTYDTIEDAKSTHINGGNFDDFISRVAHIPNIEQDKYFKTVQQLQKINNKIRADYASVNILHSSKNAKLNQEYNDALQKSTKEEDMLKKLNTKFQFFAAVNDILTDQPVDPNSELAENSATTTKLRDELRVLNSRVAALQTELKDENTESSRKIAAGLEITDLESKIASTTESYRNEILKIATDAIDRLKYAKNPTDLAIDINNIAVDLQQNPSQQNTAHVLKTAEKIQTTAENVQPFVTASNENVTLAIESGKSSVAVFLGSSASTTAFDDSYVTIKKLTDDLKSANAKGLKLTQNMIKYKDLVDRVSDIYTKAVAENKPDEFVEKAKVAFTKVVEDEKQKNAEFKDSFSEVISLLSQNYIDKISTIATTYKNEIKKIDTQYTTDITAKNTEIAKLGDTITKLKASHVIVTNENLKLTDELNQAQIDLSNVKTDLTAAESKLTTAEKSVSEKDTDIADLTAEKITNAGIIQNLDVDNKKITKELDDAKIISEDRRVEIEDYKTTINVLKADHVNQLSKELLTYNTDKAALEAELNAYKVKDPLIAKVGEVDANVQELTKKNAESMKALADKLDLLASNHDILIAQLASAQKDQMDTLTDLMKNSTPTPIEIEAMEYGYKDEPRDIYGGEIQETMELDNPLPSRLPMIRDLIKNKRVVPPLMMDPRIVAGEVNKYNDNVAHQELNFPDLKLRRDRNQPWAHDKGKLLSTKMERLRFRIDFLRTQLGLQSLLVSDTWERYASSVIIKGIQVRQLHIGAVSEARAAVVAELVKLELEYELLRIEAKYKSNMSLWARGYGRPLEYAHTNWAVDTVKTEVTLDPSSKLSDENVKLLMQRSLLPRTKNLSEGMLWDAEFAKISNKLFVDQLAVTVPQTDAMLHFYYKYVVLGAPYANVEMDLNVLDDFVDEPVQTT